MITKEIETSPLPQVKIKSALKRRFPEDTKQGKTREKEEDGENNGWFCPEMQPPLANDSLEQCFKKSNETIVSFFKTGEKYKMVESLFFFFFFFFNLMIINFYYLRVETKPGRV